VIRRLALLLAVLVAFATLSVGSGCSGPTRKRRIYTERSKKQRNAQRRSHGRHGSHPHAHAHPHHAGDHHHHPHPHPHLEGPGGHHHPY
jgi:hypothetical protein